MAEIKWIKIVTDVFDDEKILLIETLPEADSIIVIWFKMLCLAGKQNNSGVFMMNNRIPFTEEMFATIFRRPLNTVRLALNTFEEFGMIAVEDNVVTIPNWEKHQSIDKLEKLKEQSRKSSLKYRAKQKLISSGDVTVMSPVTQSDTTDKNRIDKKRLDKKRVEEVGTDSIEESDLTTTSSQLETMGGTLGQGVLRLTKKQNESLLDTLSFDEYNYYLKRLSDYIIKHPDYTIKSHYKKILEWVEEDRRN